MALGARAIVVDGGSHDDTIPIAEFFGIPHLTTPGTMYAAINAGCVALDTPWLTWINGDDILYPDAIDCRIRDAGPLDVVYGTVDFIDHAGRFVHCWRSARAGSLLTLYRSGYSPLLQQGTIFRRGVFESVGGFDKGLRFVGDADFWWRALERGHRFGRHPWPPAAAFRLHPAQMSQRHASEMRAEHEQLAAGRPRARWVPATIAISRYRFENLGSYVIRILRRPFLDGQCFPNGSYDPPHSCSTVGDASPSE
jgi:glycosyltransferase involved in cell wall biosynthesis